MQRKEWFFLKDFRNVSSVIYTIKPLTISNKKTQVLKRFCHKNYTEKVSSLPISITHACTVVFKAL